MARARSARVEGVKRQLLERLENAYQYAGGRFPSARALAARYGISYQTADRLLKELVVEGHLERRAGSGTFVAAHVARSPVRALLVFPERSRRPGSFGGELLNRMVAWLEGHAVPHSVVWGGGIRSVATGDYAVCWEAPPRILEQAARERRFALVLHARPEPGIQATWVDAVAVDDFSGGVCAAELLGLAARAGRTMVVGGPEGDLRSQGRIRGFLSRVPGAEIVHSGTWFAERAQQAAERVAGSGAQAVFCCNDRLAEAVLVACRAAGKKLPRIVGFDDAPIARELGISTVALPWEDLVETAGERIMKRLAGYEGHAAQTILAPRPVRRGDGKR